QFYFRQSGALAKLEIRDGDEWQLLDGRGGSRFVSAAGSLREHFEEGLMRGLPPEWLPYAQVAAAMSLGLRENTPEEWEQFFRLSGTMHLFAVSGMHVGIVAIVLLGI